MVTPMTKDVYSLAITVPGPKRSEPAENQDHCKNWEKDGWQLIVVADGHGSATHSDSEVGSRFACESTVEVVEAYLHDISGDAEEVFPDLKSFWEQEAFPKIHQLWNRKVDEDLLEKTKNNDPNIQNQKQISFSRAKVGEGVRYGTTLLCVLSYKNIIALGQVGDGLIAVTGESVSFPLAGSKEDLDNTRSETDSMCNHDPKPVFRAFKGAKPPRLVLACTDGIDDAFESIEALENWTLNFSAKEKVQDSDYSEETLRSFLQQCSQASGDDSTLGLIFNSQGVRPEGHVEVQETSPESTSEESQAEAQEPNSESVQASESSSVPPDPVFPDALSTEEVDENQPTSGNSDGSDSFPQSGEEQGHSNNSNGEEEPTKP